MKTDRNRLFWPDFIRACAICGVVMIHTASPLVNRYGQISNADWWTALIVGTLVRVTVLWFFLLTGALYLGRPLKIAPFLQKRAQKILLPFFFWSLVYDYQHLRPFNLHNLQGSILHILQENTSGHLWFFYTLIGLYLFLPLLNAFVHAADEGLQRYALGLWFTATALFPLLDRWTEIYPGFDLHMMTGYSGYLLLGYWLSRRSTEQKQTRLAATLFTGGLLLTLASVWHMSQASGQIEPWALGYLTPHIIVMAGASFLLLQQLATRYQTWLQTHLGAGIQALSRASFGIYLVHFVFIRLLARTGITPMTLGPAWVALPLFGALVLGLSLVFTLTLQKIPYLRALVPG